MPDQPRQSTLTWLAFAASIIVLAGSLWLSMGMNLKACPLCFYQRTFVMGIVAVFVLVVYLVMQQVRRSPFGRVLRAIRDDDQVASVAGKNVLMFKAKAFALGSGILGLAGALYAHYTSYIAPDGFVPLITIYIVLALTAGGTGNNAGAVFGAVVVVFFMESTRFISALAPGLEAVQVAAIREIMIAGSLILILHIRPTGLFPERAPVYRPPSPEVRP